MFRILSVVRMCDGVSVFFFRCLIFYRSFFYIYLCVLFILLLGCFLSASVFVVHVHDCVSGRDEQSVRRCVSTLLYLAQFPVHPFTVSLFIPLFTDWISSKGMRLSFVCFSLPPSLSLFLPLLSRLYCALSSIFYDCIVRGSKLEGNEYYKVEHNFKTLLRRLGFCFHFDFLLTSDAVCYFLFIGNSFGCLLFCYLFHWILFILERRHSLCGKCVNVTISYVYRVCEDLIQ